MKKLTQILTLILAFTTTALAQIEVLQGVELIDTNTLFNVTQVKVLGIDERTSPHRLLYRFTHPSGGIQKVNGSMMSGGRAPQGLPAFGAVELGEIPTPAVDGIQWFSPKRVGTNVNFYAKPLIEATDMVDDNMIAGKGSIMSHDDFAKIRKDLKPSSPLYQLPEEKAVAEERAPYYADKYKTTKVNFGMSGKISYLYLTEYTLKPEGERNKGLFGTAYDTKIKTNKDHTKGAFGDKNIMYKGAMMDKVPQVNDPVSGHATVFGGLKYKKNDSKKNSHFYEFLFLTFNFEGEIVKQVKYESEIPLSIENVYPVYGKNIAPDVNEITHGIFVLQGYGNKGMDHVNRKIRVVLVVDILTGEVIAEDKIELNQASTSLLRTRNLDGNRIELTYFYPVANKRGLAVVTLSTQGVEKVKELLQGSPEFDAIGLEEKPLLNMELNPVNSFESEDGGTLSIEQFTTLKKTEKGTTKRNEGYALVKYDATGSFVGIFGIGKSRKVDIIDIKDGKLWIMAAAKAGSGQSRFRFIKINIADFNVQISETPIVESKKGMTDYYYDAASGVVYLFAQNHPAKGLSVFKYKM